MYLNTIHFFKVSDILIPSQQTFLRHTEQYVFSLANH